MKLGDLIRFKRTGVIGTIVEVLPLRWKTDSGWVKVLSLNIKSAVNPSVFATLHLARVAEVISASR